MKILESIDLLVSKHGVGLSGTGGAIGKAGRVEAVQYGLDEFLGGFQIDLNRDENYHFGRLESVDFVEGETLLF
jgi:hypothetical protein